jgi:hypothetical protein
MTEKYRIFRCIQIFFFPNSVSCSIVVCKLYEVINFRGLLLNEDNKEENDDEMVLF